VLVAVLCLVGSSASAGAAETITMQAFLNDDGSGRLFVNTGYGEPWSWEACAVDLSACAPFATGRDVGTGGANPGTVFRVSGAYDSLVPGLSPVWHGNIVSVRPPSVRGALRANELVTPVPGEWILGWENEPDFMQLSVCPTPAGKGCVTLTNPHAPGCEGEAAVLDPAFVGDYLRVADRRDGPGPHGMLDYAFSSPYDLDTWKAGPRMAAVIVGRIAAATGPPRAHCGPPPLDSASISSSGVATVKCGLGCHVVLTAGAGQLRVHMSRRLPRRRASASLAEGQRPFPLRPPITLRPPRWFSDRAGARPVHLTVEIDGVRAARRTALLRR
jgi:hypothetical protein